MFSCTRCMTISFCAGVRWDAPTLAFMLPRTCSALRQMPWPAQRLAHQSWIVPGSWMVQSDFRGREICIGPLPFDQLQAGFVCIVRRVALDAHAPSCSLKPDFALEGFRACDLDFIPAPRKCQFHHCRGHVFVVSLGFQLRAVVFKCDRGRLVGVVEFVANTDEIALHLGRDGVFAFGLCWGENFIGFRYRCHLGVERPAPCPDRGISCPRWSSTPFP